jgi:hypothetical protein
MRSRGESFTLIAPDRRPVQGVVEFYELQARPGNELAEQLLVRTRLRLRERTNSTQQRLLQAARSPGTLRPQSNGTGV